MANIKFTPAAGSDPLKLNIEATQSTGTVLVFDLDQVYGTTATPETGNITVNLTDAKLGVTNIVIHNNGVAPTFSAPFQILSGSGTYVTGVLNYIYCTYLDDTHIIYAINQ